MTDGDFTPQESEALRRVLQEADGKLTKETQQRARKLTNELRAYYRGLARS